MQVWIEEILSAGPAVAVAERFCEDRLHLLRRTTLQAGPSLDYLMMLGDSDAMLTFPRSVSFCVLPRWKGSLTEKTSH